MTHADYKPVPQINETCTGCAFKWGPGRLDRCPDWARPTCTEKKIIWKKKGGK